MKKFLRFFKPSERLYFAALVTFAVLALLWSAYILAIIFTGVVMLLAVYTAVFATWHRRRVQTRLENVLFAAEEAGRDALSSLPMATVAFNLKDGAILWANEHFLKITGERENFFNLTLVDILPKLDWKWLASGQNEDPVHLEVSKRRYRVLGSVTAATDGFNDEWGVLYFEDITEHLELAEEYEQSRLAAMTIQIDNYDELFKSSSDTEKSTLIAEIDVKIQQWTSITSGFLIKSDRDKRILFFETRWLERLYSDNFQLLDKVREVRNAVGVNATVSIGVGLGASTPLESSQFAASALEMALSRGGDQAAIKDKLNFRFVGGKNQAVERNTKVKSRVMANAMQKLISESSGVIVMGHKYADFDCMGAGAGVVALARKHGKKAHIVINADTNLSMDVVRKLSAQPEYSDVFISAENAMLASDNRSLLVIVDTNRPEQVESEALLESCAHIAVIDHHRRAIEKQQADYISNSTLNFHEPSTSSASELVTDLLQYLTEPRDILKAEAAALLAGLVLDTKNFTLKTGSRTFEAAAFLRTAGADTVEVQNFFRLDIEQAAQKADIIRLAELFKDVYAVSVMRDAGSRIIAGQSADELLKISGVKASFVVFEQDNGVNISARSTGDVNVQLIMEKLGGGGNAQAAAAQSKDKTREEFRQELLKVLEKEK